MKLGSFVDCITYISDSHMFLLSLHYVPLAVKYMARIYWYSSCPLMVCRRLLENVNFFSCEL